MKIAKFLGGLAILLAVACGGSGGNSNPDNPIPEPPEIISITYYDWGDYYANPNNRTPLVEFYLGDLVVWEICAEVNTAESSLEFSLFFPAPFVGNPTYYFDYGPFQNDSNFMCYTNYSKELDRMEAAWLVEKPIGTWLLSWRIIDSQGQESFPSEEIFKIKP
jgi:hypothetical protein